MAASLLHNHDFHLVVLISTVEKGDARVATQAWALLGVLDLTQELHDLLCSGILMGSRHPCLSLCRLYIVSQAHLPEVFRERRRGSWLCVSWGHPPLCALPSSTHHPAGQQRQIPGILWALGWAHQQGSERQPGTCPATHCAHSQASAPAPAAPAALPGEKELNLNIPGQPRQAWTTEV